MTWQEVYADSNLQKLTSYQINLNQYGSLVLSPLDGKKMSWDQVCSTPEFQDLPYQIELNEEGKLEMTPPPGVNHSIFQGEIKDKIRDSLKQLSKKGKSLPEFPIKTGEGTRSVDVSWISNERLKKAIGKTASPIAPEVCIEVKSPGNSEEELLEKKELYFKAGAIEFWLCDEYGNLSFYDAKKGKTKHSAMFPDMPNKIEIDL